MSDSVAVGFHDAEWPGRLNDQCRGEWLAACTVGILDLIVFELSAGAQIAAVCEGIGMK
jgi:hypothetical protein